MACAGSALFERARLPPYLEELFVLALSEIGKKSCCVAALSRRTLIGRNPRMPLYCQFGSFPQSFYHFLINFPSEKLHVSNFSQYNNCRDSGTSHVADCLHNSSMDREPLKYQRISIHERQFLFSLLVFHLPFGREIIKFAKAYFQAKFIIDDLSRFLGDKPQVVNP